MAQAMAICGEIEVLSEDGTAYFAILEQAERYENNLRRIADVAPAGHQVSFVQLSSEKPMRWQSIWVSVQIAEIHRLSSECDLKDDYHVIFN